MAEEDLSHSSTLGALKALIKLPILSVDPKDHANHAINQPDRVVMILYPAALEDMLSVQLRAAMPTLNNEEKDKILEFGGMAGGFSDKIRLSQAFGIIDRSTKNKIDMMREIRNVAAHSHNIIDFSIKEVVNAVVSLFEGNADSKIHSMDPSGVRELFVLVYSMLLMQITGTARFPDTIGAALKELLPEAYEAVSAGKRPSIRKWMSEEARVRLSGKKDL